MFEDDDVDLLRVLRDPLLWAPPPDFKATRELAPAFARIDAAHDAAAALCASVLTGPSSQWPERVRTTPGTCTLWMVLQLLERVPALLECSTTDALQATSIAVGIAEALDPQEYWPDHVLVVRGQALRDHAYVLSLLNRHHEALQYVERAERTFAQVPGESVDLAHLALVKAAALRAQNAREETVAARPRATHTLLELGERTRY